MRIRGSVLTTLLSLAAASAPAQETLGSLAKQRGVYIGAAVGGAFWGNDARYKPGLKQFNIIVAENAMKFDQLEPSRGRFTWQRGDDLAAFAAQNGMALRGHNLLWHQASDWIANASGGLSRAEMQAILKNHIDSVVTHFKGKILEWDVVNEAIDDGTGALRESFWKQRIGADYLDSAFVWAHRADPGALLFYNDYSGEGMGGKSNRIYDLVKGMKEKGVPVHGVGLQCHFQSAKAFSTADIDRNLKRLGALGLRVSMTEVDLRVILPADTAALSLQKENYSKLFATCLANPNCKAFLTWGFTDAYSWVPDFYKGSGAALPFDAEYRPKPAYEGLQQALLNVSAIRPGMRPGSRSSGNVTMGSMQGGLIFAVPGKGKSEGGYKKGMVLNSLGKWLGGAPIP